MITEKHSITMIIVEDEIQTLNMLKKQVLDNFSEISIVGTTGSRSGAIQLIKEKKPDLALLDIILEGDTIFESLQALKDMGAKIPLSLIISAHKKSDYYDNAFKLRDYVFDYLAKPYSPSRLHEGIDKMLAVIYKQRREQKMKALQDATLNITFNTNKHILKIPVSDFVYAEVTGSGWGGINLYEDNFKHSLEMSLAKFAEANGDFDIFQISRDTVVNLHKVKELTHSYVRVNYYGQLVKLDIGPSVKYRKGIFERLNEIWND